MNYLGIYFGIKDINLVEVSGKKIVNNIRLPHFSLAVAELEEKVPAEIKLMAMLKDAFRTNRISAEEAFFCISGQDLVIRTFEIPLLPQSELKSAVNFEAKKYIPFKLEELDYDFQVLFNKKNKTSLVLFVGIKKEILTNYISISKQLNLKVDIVEYSAFSILRFLKLAGLSDAGVVAILCYDLNNEDEANFTVFENGFSLFSRDFILTGEPASFEQTVEADSIAKREKLKNEIQVSLDYYNRKFPEKDIKNIFVVSDKESRSELNSFFAESSLPVKFVETQKALGKGLGYSSILAKSFSAALFKSAPLKIKINLLEARLKSGKTVTEGWKPLALLESFKLDFKFIILGIVVCAAVFGYGLMRVKPVQEELVEIKSKRVKIDSAVGGDSLGELSALGAKYKKKIVTLDNLVKNQLYVTYPLDAIPAALPKGVWLENFSLTKKIGGRTELILSGQVYLENGEKEFESVNLFLINLKKDPVFSKYFKEIRISSVDQKPAGDKSLTVFTIVCQNFPEKK
ncbi:MAG: pilus assembly protein PilM [Candidatus Omnitrophica bacterium]|nr:pilus assembly protein PilM [Candidatus Omnitrophota bacterium]